MSVINIVDYTDNTRDTEDKEIYFSKYRVSTITCNANIGEDINLNLRNIAVTLLKNGKAELDKLQLKIFEEEIVDLVKITFINLSDSK